MVLKSFKTYVAKICKEEYGHMVLLAAFDAVDDTKFVHKVIVDVSILSISMIIVESSKKTRNNNHISCGIIIMEITLLQIY